MGARICSVLERRSGFGMPSCALLWIGTREAGSKRGLIVREDEVTAGACFMGNCLRLTISRLGHIRGGRKDAALDVECLIIVRVGIVSF